MTSGHIEYCLVAYQNASNDFVYRGQNTWTYKLRDANVYESIEAAEQEKLIWSSYYGTFVMTLAAAENMHDPRHKISNIVRNLVAI